MSKTYIGINNKAREVKKMYVGIDNIARRVKKAYIGIGNIARCIFSSDILYKYGTASNLSAGRNYLAATTIGNYALFGGGFDGSNSYSTVDTYNSSLTKGTAPNLSVGREYLAATTVGNYALFAGGVVVLFLLIILQ